MIRRALLATAAALFVSATARAYNAQLFGHPLRLDLTDSFDLAWHGDSGDPTIAKNFGELVNHLNVDGATGPWLLQLRLDTSDYAYSPQEQNRYEQNPVDLQNQIGPVPRIFEKMALSYRSRHLDATLGDFYASFGRGLVLSIRKFDELGIDTTLFGGKVVGRLGRFTGTLLAGETNTQNLDPTTATYTLDPNDEIAAARAAYRLPHEVTVGAHGLIGQAATKESFLQRNPDRYRRAGVTVDAPRAAKWLSLYGEYAHQDDTVQDHGTTGDAFYASATAYAGKTTWLFEGKRYDHYQAWFPSNDTLHVAPYMVPPTLERITVPLTENDNVTAGRLRADVDLSPSLTVYGSGEYGNEPQEADPLHLADAYAGANVRWQGGLGHVFPLFEWREETRDSDGSTYSKLVAFEYDLAQPVRGAWSVESDGQVWLREETGVAWREGQAYLALKHAPDWVVTVGYEFNDRPPQKQTSFFNASAVWNITSATSLTLFVGGQRPGLKCVSGVCRTFPAFNGARLELVARG